MPRQLTKEEIEAGERDRDEFRAWLRQQIERQDSVGLFARAALADDGTAFYGTLIGYWVNWAASEEMEEAAYDAIREFDGRG